MWAIEQKLIKVFAQSKSSDGNSSGFSSSELSMTDEQVSLRVRWELEVFTFKISALLTRSVLEYNVEKIVLRIKTRKPN